MHIELLSTTYKNNAINGLIQSDGEYENETHAYLLFSIQAIAVKCTQ